MYTCIYYDYKVFEDARINVFTCGAPTQEDGICKKRKVKVQYTISMHTHSIDIDMCTHESVLVCYEQHII